MRNGVFIIVMVVFWVEAECYERQALASLLAHDQKSKLFKVGSEVVGGTGKIHHDRSIAVLTETDHLVVLANDLGSALGEIEGERGLVSTEIVDVEDKFFGKVFGRAPDDPADTRIDLNRLAKVSSSVQVKLDLPGHTCAQKR